MLQIPEQANFLQRLVAQNIFLRYLASAKVNTKPIHQRPMKPDPMTLKVLLRKREAELQKIIRQMKEDNLHTSTVYRNLENELETVKHKLVSPPERN